MIAPYVYLVTNIVTGQFYYGSRYKNVAHGKTAADDLWKEYFTSSIPVKNLIKEHGTDSFTHDIILEDNSYDRCYWYEQQLIKENIHNNLCINIHYVDESLGLPKFSTAGNVEVGRKISAYRKSTPLTEKQLENLHNMSKSHIGKTYEEISGTEIATARKLNASIKTTEQHKNNPSNGNKNANAKTYNMIDPQGQKFIVNGNLISFCKEHKLNAGLVIATAKGRRPHYKNWIITYGN